MINTLFKSDIQLVRNHTLFASQIDNELVILDENKGQYYALNKVASTIWQLLGTPLIYSALLDTLISQYEVDRNQCEKEVQSFVSELIENKLIECL